MEIKHDVPLAPLTTFKVGGNARHFVRIQSENDLKAAAAFAAVRGQPIYVLGGGSNVLVGSAGWNGLVVKNEIKGIEWHTYHDHVEVYAGAGEAWDDVVAEAVHRGLAGIENLSWIPGTVGGAAVQNIGAYGSELKDAVVSVSAYDLETGRTSVLPKAACGFGYRTSIFKQKEGKNLVVTGLRLSLRSKGAPDMSYRDVKEYFEKRRESLPEPTVALVREAVIAIRRSKLPDLSAYGTAGSFFKNPIVDRGVFDHLKSLYPELPSFPAEGGVKIPIAWIIDHVCGLKGYRVGDAGTYEKQALVLVNYGKASADDIEDLAAHIEKAVFDKTAIRIEREVERV